MLRTYEVYFKTLIEYKRSPNIKSSYPQRDQRSSELLLTPALRYQKPQMLLREWGINIGFTYMPKFNSRESLTPEPPPLASNHIRTVSKMIEPLLTHLSCAVIGFFQHHVSASIRLTGRNFSAEQRQP